MKTTINYGFNKPEGIDVVNIDDFNSNADVMDVELAKRAMKADIPIKISQLNNDLGFITSVGAPVLSINGKVGNITLASTDIGAEPAITKNTAFNQNFETNASNIKMDGTASVGTSSNVSRADHVHPSDTTKVNQSDFNTHLADDTKHVGYAVTINVGNAYSATIPNLATLTDGLQIRVKFNVASTGAITLNIGSGIKNVVDYFGNAVTNVRLNLIANLCYDATSNSFILLGKGGGGNLATSSQLLLNITATGDIGPIVGTAQLFDDTNRTTLISLANIGDLYNQPDIAGLVSVMGSPTLTGDNFAKVATDITAQKTNLASNLSTRGQASVGTETLKALVDKVGAIPIVATPTAMITTQGGTKVVSAGYTSGGTVTASMTGLVASVITAPNVVGGVTGTATIGTLGGVRTQSGSTVTSLKAITVTGLAFQPSIIILNFTSDGGSPSQEVYNAYYNTCNGLSVQNQAGTFYTTGCSLTPNASGFTGSTTVTNGSVHWLVYE